METPPTEAPPSGSLSIYRGQPTLESVLDAIASQFTSRAINVERLISQGVPPRHDFDLPRTFVSGHRMRDETRRMGRSIRQLEDTLDQMRRQREERTEQRLARVAQNDPLEGFS